VQIRDLLERVCVREDHVAPATILTRDAQFRRRGFVEIEAVLFTAA